VEPSRLDKPLRILTFAMVFLGVLSTVLTGYLPSPQPLMVLAILLVGYFFWDSRIHTLAYSVLWHVLTLAFIAWCSYDLFINPLPGEDATIRIPIAAMRLSIFLQVFKVYNRKTDRDFVHMFVLSFFQFVSCAGVSVEFYVLPLLLLYLAVAMWALTLFHFRRQLSAPEAALPAPVVGPNASGARGRLLTPGFFAGTFIASLLVAVIGGVLFVFFPRSASSDNPLSFQAFFGSLGRRLSSGSSGSIDLDIAGIINRNPTLVMRASFPTLKDPPHTVLWRRGVLHQYDGRRNRWVKPIGTFPSPRFDPAGQIKTAVNVLLQKSPGLFIAASDFPKYNSVEDLNNDPQLIPQQYTLVHSYNRAPIFSAFSSPVAVVAAVRDVGCNLDESFYCQSYTPNNFTYTVFSRTPSRLHPAADASSQPDDELPASRRSLCTQLPRELNPRFKELAEQIARHASSDYKKALALRNYLALHCRYSLDLTQKPGRKGPLYDFLFNDKPGHCEYFASAMVILLRELGIPSRLAYGYSTGTWHQRRRVFEIRQLDAHAWAEAYIADKGWIPLDPTPPIPDDETPQTFLSVLFNPFMSVFGFCEEQWADGVIGYSRFKQKVAFDFAKATIEEGWRAIKGLALFVCSAFSTLWGKMTSGLLPKLIIAAAGMLLVLAIIPAVKRFRRGEKFRLLPRRRFDSRPSRPRVKFYEKMLRILTANGLVKNPSETPLEFAQRVGLRVQGSGFDRNPAVRGVKTITDLYCFVRFGDGKLTPAESRTVHSLLRQLATWSPPP